MSTAKEKYRVEDALLDGRTLVIRAISASDKSVLAEGMHHLSPTSLYYRFLTPKKELTEKELIYFTEVDFYKHVALLASIKTEEGEIPAGVGRYVMAEHPENPLSAELAFAVNEEFQGLGIATLLLKHLTELARTAGVKSFTALVLAENRKMLDVFKHCQLPMKTKNNVPGVLDVVLELPGDDTSSLV